MAVVQAGGVVTLGNRVVLRRTDRGEHLFPKGHVDPGETLEQTAAREVAEETGLEARIVADLGEICFTHQEEEYRVNLFLMRVLRELPEWQQHRGRDAIAVPFDRARDLLSFEEYRRIWDRALRLLRPGTG